MDKISSILPATARVTSVDLRDSSPVRAGTVGFGQAEASSASRRGHNPRTEKPFPEADSQGRVKPMSKDDQQAELVRKMNERFFNTNRTEAQTPSSGQPPGSQQPTIGGVSQAGGPSQLNAPEGKEIAKIEMLPEKPEEELEGGPTGFFKNAPAVDELYPKGSFINTVA